MARQLDNPKAVGNWHKIIHPADQLSGDTRRVDEPVQHLDRRNSLSFRKQTMVIQITVSRQCRYVRSSLRILDLI